MIPKENPIPSLLEFIQQWVPDLADRHRVSPTEIPSFVPPPLRAIYELAGNWPVPYQQQSQSPSWIGGLFGTQDHLLPLDQLNIEEGRFEFLVENQGVWICETNTHAEDPPVYSNSSSLDGNYDDISIVCDSLSHFLTTFCLHELLFGSPYLFTAESAPNKVGQLVKEALTPLWLDGQYVYPDAKYSFHLCRGEVLIMTIKSEDGSPPDIWLGFRNRSSTKLLNQEIDLTQICPEKHVNLEGEELK